MNTFIALAPEAFWILAAFLLLVLSPDSRSLGKRFLFIVMGIFVIEAINAPFTGTGDDEFIAKSRLELILQNPYSMADTVEAALTHTQLHALKAAAKGGYVVRSEDLIVDDQPRRIIMLGEQAYKDSEVAVLGEQVMRNFTNIGIEKFELETEPSAIAFSLVKAIYISPIKVLSMMTPFVAGSITESAINKNVTNLEEGSLKDYEYQYSNLPYVGKSVVIDQRNLRMAANIKTFFRAHPEKQDLLVVVNATHIQGLRRILQDN